MDGCNDQVFNLNATADNFNSVSWSGGNGTFSDVNDLNSTYTPAPGEMGAVVLEITLNSDCGNITDQITLNLTDGSLNVNAGDDLEICEGEQVFINTSSSTNDLIWTGAPGSITVNDATTSVFTPDPSETGTFTLSLSGSNDCGVATDEIQITILPSVELVTGPDLNTEAGIPVELNVSGSDNILWTPNESLSCFDCPNPFATPLTTTIYEVSDPTNSCSNVASILVTVEEKGFLYVPTAFSPNSDSQNDLFRVHHFNVDAYHMRVYNRWGVLMWESLDPSEGWDGFFKGVKQPMSAYVWHVEYNFTFDETMKVQHGNVTLVR